MHLPLFEGAVDPFYLFIFYDNVKAVDSTDHIITML